MKLRKFFAILLIVSTLTLSVAYAEPTVTASPAAEVTPAEVTPTPEPTPTPAPVQTFDSQSEIILRVGSECDEVIMLQSRLRDLGYYNYKITSYYGEKTREAVAAFQKENGLSADGVAGSDTYNVLFNNSAKRAPVKAVVKPTPKPASSSSANGAKHSSGAPVGEMKDWFNWVSKRFTYKDEVTVIDVETGIKFNVIMVGGHNHADVEPATKSDTAKLKKIYGGEWSWSRRAVVVKISGKWIAASINGMPHGYETVSGNGMDGQVCIHFLNSKTHVRNLPDADHQAMVRKAAGK